MTASALQCSEYTSAAGKVNLHDWCKMLCASHSIATMQLVQLDMCAV